MRIKFFRHVGPDNDWELNFIGEVWNLRIGSAQFALWRNDEAIFNFGGYRQFDWDTSPKTQSVVN